jgi:hypothetical protein
MSHTGQDRSRDVGRASSGGLGLPDAKYNADREDAFGNREDIDCGKA